ncbi:MAG: phage major capsid protein [Reyranellaceae bacterium]
MPELKDVLDDVQREVTAFGDDVKALKTSMEKDLAAVRKMAEDAGKAAADSPQVRKDLEALTAGIAEKHAALEAKAKEMVDAAFAKVTGRADEIERKLNRRGFGGAGSEAGEPEAKAARDFHRTSLAVRGELKVGTDLSEDRIPYDQIKSYGGIYNAYIRRGDRVLSADEMKAMSVGSDPDGGYLVTPAMSPRILSIQYESSPLRELATVETISTDAIEYPIDDDELDAGWVGETESRPETGTPQVGVQRIPVHEVYAMPKATQKFLEDASIDVEGWLARKIGEKFGRTEATAFVSGNGIKKPRGFLSYPAGTSRGQIEQIPSGAATTIKADGLINTMMAQKEFYASGSTWLMRRASIGAVMLLKDGNGQYIWRPGLEAGRPSILLGYPVLEAADMPAVEASALAVAFGNWRAAYTIVDRLGISTLRDPYTAKPFVLFYTRKRVGGDVVNFEAIKLTKIAAA